MQEDKQELKVICPVQNVARICHSAILFIIFWFPEYLVIDRAIKLL